MLDDAFLARLRCPIDPAREAKLDKVELGLVCTRCLTEFRIRDGLPILTANDANLPPDVPALRQLPCQKHRTD